jgi:hypothetical protein
MIWLALHRNRGPNRTVTIDQVERLHPADVQIVADETDEPDTVEGDASPPLPNETASEPSDEPPKHGNGGSPSGSETNHPDSGTPSFSTGSTT